MSKRTMTVALAVLLVAVGNVAIGQENLKDIVEEQGYGWMMAKWTAATDSGQSITINFQWAVKGHAIITGFEMGERSSHGMIYFDADEQAVKQFSVDSRGQATKATWEPMGVKALCRTQMTDEYGDRTDVGIAYSKVDDTTMKVEVYRLENGQVPDYPAFQMNFTKAKKKAEN